MFPTSGEKEDNKLLDSVSELISNIDILEIYYTLRSELLTWHVKSDS